MVMRMVERTRETKMDERSDSDNGILENLKMTFAIYFDRTWRHLTSGGRLPTTKRDAKDKNGKRHDIFVPKYCPCAVPVDDGKGGITRCGFDPAGKSVRQRTVDAMIHAEEHFDWWIGDMVERGMSHRGIPSSYNIYLPNTWYDDNLQTGGDAKKYAEMSKLEREVYDEKMRRKSGVVSKSERMTKQNEERAARKDAEARGIAEKAALAKEEALAEKEKGSGGDSGEDSGKDPLG